MGDPRNISELNQIPGMEQVVLLESVSFEFGEERIGAVHCRLAAPIAINVFHRNGVEHNVRHYSKRISVDVVLNDRYEGINYQ